MQWEGISHAVNLCLLFSTGYSADLQAGFKVSFLPSALAAPIKKV